MRWVVAVYLLAGCFSKPGLREGDGGVGDDDAGDGGDGGGDGSITDGPLEGCSWTPLGIILDDTAKDERHPWISDDGKIVIFWTGDAPGNTGVMWQAERTAVDAAFGAPVQIFPQPPGTTAPAEGDPAFTHGLMKMYIHTNSGIQAATRAMPDGKFSSAPVDDPELATVTSIRQVQEGGFLTDDGKTFLFVAGDSADPYTSEDLYIASRRASAGAFGTPTGFAHNVSGANECCPTMAGNVLMYEREAALGKTEIVSSIFNGTTFSSPELVVLPGSNSFQQPSLSADGKRLVYVVNSGNDWHLEEAKLECP